MPPWQGPYGAGCRAEGSRVREPRNGSRGGKPTGSSGWKAGGLGAGGPVRRPPAGAESGAWRPRGNAGTWESPRSPGGASRHGGTGCPKALAWSGRFDQPTSPLGTPRTCGAPTVSGPARPSAGPCDGQVAGVASQRPAARGAVRPKRATGGQATSGGAFWWGRYTRETLRSPSVSPAPPGQHVWVAAALPEEPHACLAHVRVCGGAGWVTIGSTRQPTASSVRSYVAPASDGA